MYRTVASQRNEMDPIKKLMPSLLTLASLYCWPTDGRLIGTHSHTTMHRIDLQIHVGTEKLADILGLVGFYPLFY